LSVLEGEAEVLHSLISKHNTRTFYDGACEQFVLLTLEDGTDRLSQNICSQLADCVMLSNIYWTVHHCNS